MSKKLAWFITIFSAFAISLFLILILIFGYNVYRNSNPLSQVTVEGTAKRSVKYDEASIIYYITQEGANTEELNAQVDSIVGEVTDYLKSQGISDEDIVTNKNSYQSYSYDRSPDGEEVFVAQGSVEVTFQDLQSNLELPNQVTEEVTSLGVNNFSGYNYRVSNQDELCEELKTEAIKDASDKAEDRVEALDGGRIVRKSTSETTGCGQDFFPFFDGAVAELAASSDGAQASQPVFTGEQDLEVKVQLIAEYR